MKKFFRYIVPCGVVLLAASCGSDDVIADVESADDMVEVTLSPRRTAVSRFDDQGFDNGDRITTWLIKNNSQLTDQKTFVINDGQLQSTSGKYYKSRQEELIYFGICGSYAKSGNQITVSGGNTDVLYTLVQSADTYVELPFWHLFGKLRLKVTNAPAAVRSVQLLNISNKAVIEFDLEEETYMSCDGLLSSVNMYKDSEEYPYYYYIPAMNYLPRMKAVINLTNGASYQFNFDKFGYIHDNELLYLSANLAGKSGSAESRSGDVDGYIECVKTVDNY